MYYDALSIQVFTMDWFLISFLCRKQIQIVFFSSNRSNTKVITLIIDVITKSCSWRWFILMNQYERYYIVITHLLSLINIGRENNFLFLFLDYSSSPNQSLGVTSDTNNHFNLFTLLITRWVYSKPM